MRISVAMATFNGEKYIFEQMSSILRQLGNDDEIIVSDDHSTDATIEIIESFNDKRIKLYISPGKGIRDNFENAIKYCSNEIIFLSDQDDVWLSKKVEKVKACFKSKKIKCVVHTALACDDALVPLQNQKKEKLSKSIFKNFVKNTFQGSCMAFSSDIKDKIIPIPKKVRMHDFWIGIVSRVNGEIVCLNEDLILYRRHDLAATISTNSIFKKIQMRMFDLHLIIKLVINKYAK